MKRPLLFVLAACVLIAADSRPSPRVPGNQVVRATPGRVVKDASQRNDLPGTWDNVRGEFEGKVFGRIDVLNSSKTMFAKDRLYITAQGKRYGPFPYRVNQAVKPYQIDADVTFEGVVHKAKGIYRVLDDELWICVRENTRPTAFSASPGSQAALAFLRRQSR